MATTSARLPPPRACRASRRSPGSSRPCKGSRPCAPGRALRPPCRRFQLPRGAVPSLLVGGGYGAAPLYFLAEELLRRGKPVNMIIGARDHERVFKPVEGKRLSDLIVVATEDGSMGERGRVTDFLS